MVVVQLAPTIELKTPKMRCCVGVPGMDALALQDATKRPFFE